MLGMNGLERFKRLKSRGGSAIVVMVTARNCTDDVFECLRTGAAAYVIEPFKADDLRERIAKILCQLHVPPALSLACSGRND